MSRKPSFSLLTVVAVVMTVPVIAISALLVQFAGIATRSLADRLGTQLLTRNAAAAVSDIEAFLDRVEWHSDYAVSKFDRGVLRAEDPEQLWPDLLETLTAFPTVSATHFAFADGEMIGVLRDGADGFVLVRWRDGIAEERRITRTDHKDRGRAEAEPQRSYPLEPAQWPWGSAATETDVPVWTAPYAAPGSIAPGTTHSAYTRSIRDADGATLGVLASSVSLTALGDHLRSLPYAADGHLLVCDREGRIVAATLAPAADQDGSRVEVAALPGVSVAMRESILGHQPLQTHQTATMLLGGRPVRGVNVGFGTDRGLDWSLVATMPESSFFGEAWAVQRHLLLISGGVLGISVLLAARLGRGLTRPILRLREHVHALGDGDFDHHMVIEALREMEDLNADLNRMAGQLRERVTLRQAIDLATEVQQSLLPRPVLRRPGLDLCGQSQYCDATGGDYYDFIEVKSLGSSATLVAVGDVMGHGVAAALLMASARAALRAQALQSGSLASMMDIVNRVLAQSRGRSWFMTMFLLMVDTEQRSFRWASAGHTLALVHDPTTHETRELDGGDLPLGIDGTVCYQEYAEESLPPNAIILLGTDGIWEAVNEAEEPFGMEPVVQILRTFGDRGAEEIASRLRDAVTAHRGTTKAVDDVTFVVVRLAADPAREKSEVAGVRAGRLQFGARTWPEPTGPFAPESASALPHRDD